MVSHYIILSSSYSKGKRIGMDFIINSQTEQEIIKTRNYITSECGGDSISIHLVHAENEKWNSLCKADSYFSDIEVIKDVDKFIKLILQDRSLSALDIAKYILATTNCTQIKLQKLLYYCYADYLCKYDGKLFDESILAYKYGPVVKNVLQKYKKYKYEIMDEEEYDISVKTIKELPARSRIIFAKDGVNKALSIDETMKKYRSLTATELVKLTHRKNTPWSQVFEEGSVKVIEDMVIKKYHENELVI